MSLAVKCEFVFIACFQNYRVSYCNLARTRLIWPFFFSSKGGGSNSSEFSFLSLLAINSTRVRLLALLISSVKLTYAALALFS